MKFASMCDSINVSATFSTSPIFFVIKYGENFFFCILIMMTTIQKICKCDVVAPPKPSTSQSSSDSDELEMTQFAANFSAVEQGDARFGPSAFNAWAIIPHTENGIYPISLPMSYDHLDISLYWDAKDPIVGSTGFLQVYLQKGDDQLVLVIPKMQRCTYHIPVPGIKDLDLAFKNFSTGIVSIQLLFSDFTLESTNVVQIDPSQLPLWCSLDPSPIRRQIAKFEKQIEAQHEGGPVNKIPVKVVGTNVRPVAQIQRDHMVEYFNTMIGMPRMMRDGNGTLKEVPAFVRNDPKYARHSWARHESGAASAVPKENAITDAEVVEITSNVVLSETQGESVDQAAEKFSPYWYQLSTTEECHEFPYLTDRWLQYKTFTWKTTYREGTLMMYDVMPLSYLNSRSSVYCNTPNFINFNIHSYWRGDLEFKLHINSNQFQSGMLMMSWLYAADSYNDAILRDTRYSNIASLVQQPHVKLNAGSSNEATLTVPYNYVKPFVRTKNIYPNSIGTSTALNLGRITVTPLVELKTGTSADSPKSCDVTLFIKFVTTKFTGMVDGTIAKPSVAPKSSVVAYAESGVARIIRNGIGIVDKIIGDINADDPPATRPPQFLVPMNSQSWAHGTNSYEPTFTLRLDGGRIGVGRSPDIGYSDTGIQGIVGVYGLLRPITWSSADAAINRSGSLLWSMGVHPQCDKDKLYVNTAAGKLDSYTIPPCGVVSSLFCYWRGSLNFKFDIVATSKHTGRVLVAYIPGYDNTSNVPPTLDQAKSSSYVEFSLNTGTNSFTFNVPFIAETMWWPRKYGGPQRSSDFLAPSTIVMFVLNQLVPMESVSREVIILPFVCAGPDFEVSVPSQPAIGLASNRVNSVPDMNKVQFKSGYFPVYVGEWRNFFDGKYCIMRYGEVSDHIAQLTTPPKPPAGKAYYYYIQDNRNYKPYKMAIKGGTHYGKTVAALPFTDYTLGYGVIFSLDGYYYMIPFPITNNAANPGETAAQIAAIAAAKNKWSDVQDILPAYSVVSDYITQDNIQWTPRAVDIPAQAESGEPTTISREESPNPLQPTRYLPSTRNGIVTYGESFHDLKDLCRRYQLYYEGTVSPVDIRANKRNAAFLQVPVMAQGLALDPSIENPVWNNMRDGHIPIISSGFRFYRGGIRFRIVITGLQDSVWVQHHPDRYVDSQKAIIGRNIQGKDAYRNHTYAFHVQNLSVNRTIEIEIPYYKPGLYSLTGDIGGDFNSKAYGSLGDVVIGLEGDQPVNDPIDVAIYYSLADDCSFNKFCGFPMMVFCDEVFRANVPPIRAGLQSLGIQPLSESNRRPTKQTTRRIPRALHSSDEEMLDEWETPEIAEHEMMNFMTATASSVFGNLAGKFAVQGTNALAAPVVRVVKEEVKEHIKPMIAEIETTVADAAKDISSALGRTIPQQAIVTALGQFAQVAMNPTPAAIGVAVTTSIANFVIVSAEMLFTLQELLTKFLANVWNKYFSVSSDLQEDRREATPEGFFDEMNDKTLHGFLGMLFAAVSSTIGITVASPGKFPNIMKGVKEALNVCNASVIFFRNIVDSVVYMYKYCLGATSEELRAKIIIEREYPHMKDWCNEVMNLLDPRNTNTILHSTRQANRIFDACIYGAKLINENLDKNIAGGRVIYDLYIKLCKLRDDLVELGNHPDIRFEAFPLWCSGPAGVGKSYMTQEICKELLTSIDYQTQECMIYWLALGQKYWNGIKNPPVIARDEAYAVGGQFTEEEIATHLAICSSSILNPPMAALQEKNKRLNPLIYYMNSNLEFPQINEARHPEAIYRRRKLMVKVDYTDDVKARYPNILDASELPPQEKQNFSHLQFMIARDPKDRNTTWAGPYTYSAFINIAKEKFRNHVNQERVNFRHRMAAAYSLDPDYNPADQLNYIHGMTLTPETLHEVYIRERNMARQILFVPPPTIENDSYLQGILDRFAYLWTTPVMPEMDIPEEEQPSTSQGFFSERVRRQARVLERVTGLSRATALKMCSDTEFSDEEIGEMAIDPAFSDMVKRGMLKMGGAVLTEYISMLPEAVIRIWQRCGWNDWSATGSRFIRTMLPHWSDLEGTLAIRSYLYWKMRELQMRHFCHVLLETSTRDEILSIFYGPLRKCLPAAIITKLSQAATDRDIMEFMAVMDTLNVANQDHIAMLYALTLALNGVTTRFHFCDHCRFWVTYLNDTSNLEYNIRYNTILYYNALHLPCKFDGYCTCQGMSLNKVYLTGMRIVWNDDHGTIGYPNSNPFVYAEHRVREEVITSWLKQVLIAVKDWWKCVAMPFVSTILTFLYEHFGQIISLLLGVYSLYKITQSSSEKVAAWYYSAESDMYHFRPGQYQFDDFVRARNELERNRPVAPYSFQIIKGYVYVKDLFNTPGYEHHTAEYARNLEASLAESAGYTKVGIPKPAKAAMKPANREGYTIDAFERRVSNNICFIGAQWVGPNEQGENDICEIHHRCIAIGDRRVLVIRHYIEELLLYHQGATFMLDYHIQGKPATAFIRRDVLEGVRWFKGEGGVDLGNLGIMTLPKYVPMFKNIVNSICKQNDHAYVGKYGHIIRGEVDGPTIRHISLPIEQREKLIVAGDHKISQRQIDVTYKYQVHGKGMCGSMLVAENVCQGNCGLIAIHVAGHDEWGYAEPIYREMFEMPDTKPETTLIVPCVEDLSGKEVELDANLLIYGTVKPQYSHHESGKSKIVPSLMHGRVYEVTTEPNPLRPNDPRQPPGSDPLRDGCLKHGQGWSKPFPMDLVEAVSEDQRQVLLNKVKNPLNGMRELTMQESVCGTTSIPFCEALNWKSSEGHPLSSLRPPDARNKKYLFDLIEQSDGYYLQGMNETLSKMMEMRKTARNKKVNIPPIYIDCLKDYRLPKEKCKIRGKTRIFSIAPIQVTLDVRKYMGLFLSGYRAATIQAQHGIGINADSPQWTELADYLHEVSDYVVTGDYSNYGPTLSSQLVSQVFDDIMYWHEMNGASEDQMFHLRWILENEILNPLHLCKNLVYQTINGIPSGSPITAELNSEVNKYYVKLAFLLLSRIHKLGLNMTHFNDKVRLVTYGDDFIMSVHEDYIPWFNCATISEVLKEYGILLTDVEKGLRITPYRSLFASSFLKRKFSPHPKRVGFFLAPIEMQSITECINWCHKQLDMVAATAEVVRASCVLAYGHGPEFYKKHVERLRREAIRLGLELDLPTWRDMDETNFGGGAARFTRIDLSKSMLELAQVHCAASQLQ